MNNFQKAKDILDLVVAAAASIVTIAELWEKHGPEVKKALKETFYESAILLRCILPG